uniref:Uncharacterized protein n=1 Tax=Rhizophora mucronata TaxID=61149 RepID=A0A2P2J5C6_RHIMU
MVGTRNATPSRREMAARVGSEGLNER